MALIRWALTLVRDSLYFSASGIISFRFHEAVAGLCVAGLATAGLTSCATTDTSRSINTFMIQARWLSTSRSYFKTPLNWSLNCQLAACSEVLAESAWFILALPTPLATFFPSLLKKKLQWVCNVERDKICLIKLWLISNFTKTAIFFSELNL